MAVRASEIALSVNAMAKLENYEDGDDVLKENLEKFLKSVSS